MKETIYYQRNGKVMLNRENEYYKNKKKLLTEKAIV